MNTKLLLTRVALLMVLSALFVVQTWAANIVIDLNLTQTATYPDGFPNSSTDPAVNSGTYTFGGYSFTLFAPTKILRFSTNTPYYLTLQGVNNSGESDAGYITFPAIANYKLTQVVLTPTSAGSTAVSLSICSSYNNVVSGGTSWTYQQSGTVTNKTWNLTGTSANTAYKMYIVKASGKGSKNCQIAGLKLTYEPAASCADPTAPSNSSITSRGATLSTTSNSADYQFFCSTSSSPASKTGDYTVSSGQSVTVSNLKYGTTYYYWARHDCGSSSYSSWVAGSPTSFTTTCPNSLSVSAGTLTTSGATFTITDSNSPTYISFNGSGYGYEIYYSTSNDSPGESPSGTATTASTSKSVTGLSAGQKYYYWVRGYGPNGHSSWVSGGDFTTLDLSSIAITTDPTKMAYIHGETFDKTGAVVTATYTNSTTANVSSSAVWTPSTALTTTGSNTITASYTENGTEKTATTSVTVYGVTMQALDDGGNTIPATGPDAPTRSVATITPKADKGNYVW